MDLDFGLGLWVWTWPLEASHYARSKAPILIFYWLLSARLFGLSTKFGHSIPRLLDLNNDSVKQPLHLWSKVAGHIPARISDVPSWDAKTNFFF
jgi:hypothetical protein